MSGVNNDGNKISQFYESIKTEVKSAVKSLKELVKPKEAGRADNKDSNVKTGGEKTGNPPTLTKSDSSGSLSSASSLGKALQTEGTVLASPVLTRTVNERTPDEITAGIREALKDSPDIETFISKLNGMGEAITSKYVNADKKLIEEEKTVILKENKSIINNYNFQNFNIHSEIKEKFPEFHKNII